jgi:hypothetical protein
MMTETKRVAQAAGQAIQGLVSQANRQEFALRFAENLGIGARDEKARFVRLILKASHPKIKAETGG